MRVRPESPETSSTPLALITIMQFAVLNANAACGAVHSRWRQEAVRALVLPAQPEGAR
jgi:hypothetical protein